MTLLGRSCERNKVEERLNPSLHRDRHQTDGHPGRPFTASSMAEEKQGNHDHSLNEEVQLLMRVGVVGGEGGGGGWVCVLSTKQPEQLN